MAELTPNEIAAAGDIVRRWNWQLAEGHFYRWRHAVKTLTRYYECPSMMADQFRLILEYLRHQKDLTQIEVNNKLVTLDGAWSASDAWYQTANGDKFDGTESNRVRVYQTLLCNDTEGDDADGPYVEENGCQYKVTRTYYWNVPETPPLPASSSGINYTIQGRTVDRDTGLVSCVIERRERVEQEIKDYRQAVTSFETRNEEQHLGVKAALVESRGKPASAGGGKLVQRILEKNPDCTTNVRNVSITELYKAGAVVITRKTLRGTSVSVTDRNATDKLPTTGLEVGEERRSELTDGGRWNNTVTRLTHEPAGTIEESCEEQPGVHTHSQTENTPDRPKVDQTPVQNQSKSMSGRRTEDGSWDVRTVTQTFRKLEAEVRGKGALKTDITSRSFRNALTDTVPETPGVNRTVDASVTQNEHGSYDGQVRVVRYELATAAAAGKGSVKAAVDLTSFRNRIDGTVEDTPEINKSVDVSISQNDHGSYDGQIRVVRYELATASAAGKGSEKAVVTSRSFRNALTDTVPETPGVNRSVDVSVNQNDHGSYDGQVRIVDYKLTTAAYSGKGAVVTSVSQRTFRHATSPDIPETPDINRTVDASVTQNEHGSYDGQVRVVDYRPVRRRIFWSDDNYHYSHCSYKNATDPETPPSGGSSSASFVGNDHGSYDGSWTHRTDNRTNWSGTGIAWSKTGVELSTYVYYMSKDKLCRRLATCTADYYYGLVKNIADLVASGDKLAIAGWESGFSSVGADYAHGRRYSNIQLGDKEIMPGEDD